MTIFLIATTPKNDICISYNNVSMFDDNNSIVKCFSNIDDLKFFLYEKKKIETKAEIYSTDFLVK